MIHEWESWEAADNDGRDWSEHEDDDEMTDEELDGMTGRHE